MKWPAEAEARRRMIEALLVWVEEIEKAEPEPEGVDPEVATDVPDLYATVAALESLRREVGIQGRAFSRLAEASRQADAEVEKRFRESLLRERESGHREVLAGLLDARDRFARSLSSLRKQVPLLAGRLLRKGRRRAALAALEEGLRLNLEAVDEALRENDCREIPAEGRPFDPRTMRAVEVAGPEEGPEGTVAAVIRAGWLAGNEVLRPAEVRAVPAGARGRSGKGGGKP